jgi:hexosaminidase
MKCCKWAVSLLLVSALLGCGKKHRTASPPELAIVPRPTEMQAGKGEFVINHRTKIITEASNAEYAALGSYLAQKISSLYGYDLLLAEREGIQGEDNAILLVPSWTVNDLGGEGYELTIENNRILITANRPQGVFYGIQSLLQLLPLTSDTVARVKHQGDIPVGTAFVHDKPSFGWRGMHLDVSCHFYPVRFIKKYIDLMASHKINRFIWHLTGDNGWRLEIQSLPELTSVGAWRAGRNQTDWSNREPRKKGEIATYGGYYTRDDIEEIVDYAGSRFVEIIPEISLPGNTLAALAAYPRYACMPGPFEVATGAVREDDEHILCAGRPETLTFIDKILEEVALLFPGEYISIGSTSFTKSDWENCPRCRQKVSDEGFRQTGDLEVHIVNHIKDLLESKGRQLVVWDEEGIIGSSSVVLISPAPPPVAGSGDRQVVVSPEEFSFDTYLTRQDDGGSKAILRQLYETTAGKGIQAMGLQGRVPTGYLEEFSDVEMCLIPFMGVLAEFAWTVKPGEDFSDFGQRMEALIKRLQEEGYKPWEPRQAIPAEQQAARADSFTSGS